MDGVNIGKGLKKFNGSMGTTIEVDDSYVCQANHTHHANNIVGVITREEFDELKKEMQYMKDFLVYKQVMVDENEFKEFVESRKVAQKLLEASKPKKFPFNIDILDGYHATTFATSIPHTHTISMPITFAYQPYLPIMSDPDKEDK